MKEIVEKFSSYNIFNYLFPGFVFVGFTKQFTSYTFFQNDMLTNLFVSYFIGLVISRIGSLLLEPFLIKISFLKFANYSHFLKASKKDPKIETLSEVNNMYRTLCSLLFLLLPLKLIELLEMKYPIIKSWSLHLLIILLLILFLFSYRKQTNYITKRIMKKEN